MLKTKSKFDIHSPDRVQMRAAMKESHDRSTREALLEHARLGRSICEGDRAGGVVWITPVEIFARYGLDEFGRAKE